MLTAVSISARERPSVAPNVAPGLRQHAAHQRRRVRGAVPPRHRRGSRHRAVRQGRDRLPVESAVAAVRGLPRGVSRRDELGASVDDQDPTAVRRRDPERRAQQVRVRPRARRDQARPVHLRVGRVPDRLRLRPRDAGARRRSARRARVRVGADVPRLLRRRPRRSGCSGWPTRRDPTTTSCACRSTIRLEQPRGGRRPARAAAQGDRALLRHLQGPRPRSPLRGQGLGRPRVGARRRSSKRASGSATTAATAR